jgi:hypothetical protein
VKFVDEKMEIGDLLSLLWYESRDEELTVLPRHTKVIVTGITGQSWLLSACRVLSRRLLVLKAGTCW